MSGPATAQALDDPSADGAAPGADRARPARRALVALLLLGALGVLALAVLGSSAQRETFAVFEGGDEVEDGTVEEVREPYTEPDWSVHEVPQQDPGGGTQRIITVALIALGVVLLAVLLAWLVRRMRALARDRPEEAEEVPVEDLTEEQARTALADARTRLSLDVDAQDAVITAWLALEDSLQQAGVRRAPSQTTLEFVVAVLGALQLERAALERFAALYRRALFDPEPLAETDRQDALAQLDTLSAQLEARAR